MKKEILIFAYDMEIGGAERSLINMLESFDYGKYHVDLLIARHTGELMKFIPPAVNVLPEMRAYTVFRTSFLQGVKDGHYAISGVKLISRYMARMKARRRGFAEGSGYMQMQLVAKYGAHLLPKLKKTYDIAISYAWPHNIVADAVYAKRKMAWIHTDYSQLEIDNKIDLQMWSKFDHIISISEECTNAFLSKYPSLQPRVQLIENINAPVFVQNMAGQSPAFPEGDESFRIVSVGRLSYAKGFDTAIQALRRLHDIGLRDIKWYVVGFGAEEEALKQLIMEQGLEQSFILLGKKTNPYPYMKACDLYVQPSRYEGKAVTVTEAKMLGKPVLLTHYPTADSQLENGVEGMICDCSVDGLVSGIAELYENEQLRSRLSANTRAKDYSNTAELDKLYVLIDDV